MNFIVGGFYTTHGYLMPNDFSNFALVWMYGVELVMLEFFLSAKCMVRIFRVRKIIFDLEGRGF